MSAEVYDVAWLVGLYGPDPRQVGAVDGTEDDRGDAVVDVLVAARGRTSVQDEWQLHDRLDEAWRDADPATWEELLALVRQQLAS